jgi:hypothetical protein
MEEEVFEATTPRTQCINPSTPLLMPQPSFQNIVIIPSGRQLTRSVSHHPAPLNRVRSSSMAPYREAYLLQAKLQNESKAAKEAESVVETVSKTEEKDIEVRHKPKMTFSGAPTLTSTTAVTPSASRLMEMVKKRGRTVTEKSKRRPTWSDNTFANMNDGNTSVSGVGGEDEEEDGDKRMRLQRTPASRNIFNSPAFVVFFLSFDNNTY